MFENTIDLNTIFTIKNAIIYFIGINLFGFFIMWLDKRKAKKGSWRIPEKTLFIITAIRWWNRNNFWNVYVQTQNTKA